MKSWLAITALTFLAYSQAEDDYFKYGGIAIKRFQDDLRRLGVDLPLVTVPDEPVVLSPPTVTSPAGDFEGYWKTSHFGRRIAAFEGIPYAQPPVGPLRFKVAQPLPRLSAPLKTIQPGNKCVQVKDLSFSTDEIIGDEDCLFLNVYVPENTTQMATESLPVIFHIHPGGFISGGGSDIQPGILLDKDVVFVTTNYRHGPLGFLTTMDETIPGNLGLKDQVAALRWTKENIASFGGNADLITVFGIADGAADSEFLMLSPLTRGLIQRVITTSGSATATWARNTPEKARTNVRRAAEVLGCPVEPSVDLLACLQTKNASEITSVSTRFQKGVRVIPVPFRPIVEGNTPGSLLPDLPENLLSSTNRSNDVPLMTGLTSEEGILFGTIEMFNNPEALKGFDNNISETIERRLYLPAPANEGDMAKFETLKRAYFGTGPLERRQELLGTNLFTDVAYLWPAVKSIQSHVKGAKSSAFLYYFNFKGSRNIYSALGIPQLKDLGVAHGEDLLYLVPIPGPVTPQDVAMLIIYSDLYANFARDGIPSSKLLNLSWSPITSGEGDMPYLHIKSPSDIKLKKNLLRERWLFLKTLFDGNSTQS